MTPSDNVIDFALFRKRKQAQQMGRLMWAFYSQQAGLAAQPWAQACVTANPPRQA